MTSRRPAPLASVRTAPGGTGNPPPPPGAVAAGHQNQPLFGHQHPPVQNQRTDPRCPRIGNAAAGVETGRRGKVDLIGQTRHHIEGKGRNVRVDQRRIALARDQLHKQARRPLKPIAQATGGHVQRDDPVGMREEIAQMPQTQRPGRNIGVIFRPAPSAHPRGRHRSQHGCQQGRIRLAQPRCDMAHHRRRRQIQHGRGPHQREMAVDPHRGLADHLCRPRPQPLIGWPGDGHDLRVIGHIRRKPAAVIAPRHGAQPGPAAHHLPASALPRQRQVNHPKMRPMRPRKHQRYRACRAFRRKNLVAVPGDNGIHPGKAKYRSGRMFAQPVRRGSGRLQPGMRQRHHHIGPRRPQPGGLVPHRGPHFRNRHGFAQMVPLPKRGLRRQNRGDTDPQRMHLPRLVRQAALHDKTGPVQRASLGIAEIGRQHRKLGICQTVVQKGTAKAEFMVAQTHGIIAQAVHRGDHRMGRPLRDRPALRQIFGQRAAGQKIAIVEQDRHRHLCPRRSDQPGQPRQANPFGRQVGMMIPRQQLAMQVAGGQEAKHGRVRGRSLRVWATDNASCVHDFPFGTAWLGRSACLGTRLQPWEDRPDCAGSNSSIFAI